MVMCAFLIYPDPSCFIQHIYCDTINPIWCGDDPQTGFVYKADKVLPTYIN